MVPRFAAVEEKRGRERGQRNKRPDLTERLAQNEVSYMWQWRPDKGR